MKLNIDVHILEIVFASNTVFRPWRYVATPDRLVLEEIKDDRIKLSVAI